MQREVRKNVDDRNDQCPSFKKHNRINLFEYENRIGHQQFCVRRHDAYGGRVCFQEHENHILIEWIGMNGEPAKAPIKITLTLNNEGECRPNRGNVSVFAGRSSEIPWRDCFFSNRPHS